MISLTTCNKRVDIAIMQWSCLLVLVLGFRFCLFGLRGGGGGQFLSSQSNPTPHLEQVTSEGWKVWVELLILTRVQVEMLICMSSPLPNQLMSLTPVQWPSCIGFGRSWLAQNLKCRVWIRSIVLFCIVAAMGPYLRLIIIIIIIIIRYSQLLYNNGVSGTVKIFR
jgi:hypothetical protein